VVIVYVKVGHPLPIAPSDFLDSDPFGPLALALNNYAIESQVRDLNGTCHSEVLSVVSSSEARGT
jgi:hypothetical protein